MKVLIVDGSAASRARLGRVLAGLGHEWVAAEDGVRAWQELQGSGADVVISSWTTPDADGEELCRRIRSDASAPHAYFLVLPAPKARKQAVAAIETGADDYLTKPVDEQELAARLTSAERVAGLRRRVAEQEAELARLNAELLEDSRRDELTGLGNRRREDEDLATLVGRAERYGHSFGVALFDVDRLAALNDTAGRGVGDEVLRSMAGALVHQCRTGDAVYRHGGEELLVVYPDQTLERRRRPLSGCAA